MELNLGRAKNLVYLFSAFDFATSHFQEKVLKALELLKRHDTKAYDEVVQLICTRSKTEIGILFHHARKMWNYKLAAHLRKYCLSREDLQESIPWFLASPNFNLTLTQQITAMEGNFFDMQWLIEHMTDCALNDYTKDRCTDKLQICMAIFKRSIHFVDLAKKVSRKTTEIVNPVQNLSLIIKGTSMRVK